VRHSEPVRDELLRELKVEIEMVERAIAALLQLADSRSADRVEIDGASENGACRLGVFGGTMPRSSGEEASDLD
jgi:hypothetical protein